MNSVKYWHGFTGEMRNYQYSYLWEAYITHQNSEAQMVSISTIVLNSRDR